MKKNRVGEININSKGQKMEIIEYNSASDIKVLFENGIVKNTRYCQFKNGQVSDLVSRVGEKSVNSKGRSMEIIEYNGATDLVVVFDNGETKHCAYKEFKKGYVSTKEDLDYSKRLGEENISNEGLLMKIIEYTTNDNIIVEFENGYKIKTTYSTFKGRGIKNYLHQSVCGVGYIGIGKYETNIYKEAFSHWNNMLKRCYSGSIKIKRPTYKDCTVCEEWHNFQNFAKWYDENKWMKTTDYLDKDILLKNNKVYSPSSCILVDNRINCLFTKSENIRGEYPIGVYKQNNKYIASCSVIFNGIKEHKRLGSFTTPEEAFCAYKQFKENYIKQVANEYKEKFDNFPKRLYDALLSYKVEVCD